MNHKLAQRLSASKDGIEFIKYIKEVIASLDSVQNIADGPAELIALEVRARERAIEKLITIISPLINAKDIPELSTDVKNEYLVDVD